MDAILLLPADGADADDVLLVAWLARVSPESGPCPDANTLAAWAETRLTGRRRRRVEAHVACCDDCREGVAATVAAA